MFCLYREEQVDSIGYVSCYKLSDADVLYMTREHGIRILRHTPSCDEHLEIIVTEINRFEGEVLTIERNKKKEE